MCRVRRQVRSLISPPPGSRPARSSLAANPGRHVGDIATKAFAARRWPPDLSGGVVLRYHRLINQSGRPCRAHDFSGHGKEPATGSMCWSSMLHSPAGKQLVLFVEFLGG